MVFSDFWSTSAVWPMATKVYYPLGLMLLAPLFQVYPEPFFIEINRKIRPFLKTLDKKKSKKPTNA